MISEGKRNVIQINSNLFQADMIHQPPFVTLPVDQ